MESLAEKFPDDFSRSHVPPRTHGDVGIRLLAGESIKGRFLCHLDLRTLCIRRQGTVFTTNFKIVFVPDSEEVAPLPFLSSLRVPLAQVPRPSPSNSAHLPRASLTPRMKRWRRRSASGPLCPYCASLS